MKNLYFTILFFLCTSYFYEVNASIIYVKQGATGNGTSWENASDLQDALAAANEGDEIWVAAGTYKPAGMDGDRTSTFLIGTKLTLLGGFPDGGGSLEDRDPTTHETILSGDLNGNDLPDDFETNREDNSYTILKVAASVLEGGIIDGFIFKSGHADGSNFEQQRGGGMLINGPMEVSHCILEQNFAFYDGGAVACLEVSSGVVWFKFCKFERNRSNLGGGVVVRLRDVHFEDCSFIGNLAVESEPGFLLEKNGAAAFVQNSNCFFKRDTFMENFAQDGGTVLRWVTNDAEGFTYEVDSCWFENNTATAGAALFFGNWGKNITTRLTNTTFLNNHTTGIYQYGTVSMVNSQPGANGNTLVDNCHFEGNSSAWGVGALEIGSGPDAGPSTYTISNTSFINNFCEQNGGALDLWAEVNTIAEFNVQNCRFEGNQSGMNAGALWIDTGSDDYLAHISHCEFVDNTSAAGGVIASYQDLATPATPTSAQLTLDNCLLANNEAETAAIAITDLVNLELINCTVADNTSDAIALDTASTLILQNTILYNPQNAELETLTAEAVVTSSGGNLFGDSTLAVHAHPSDHQNADPLLTNDFYLMEGSPAVDAGINSGDLSELDLGGNDRVINCVDIGAYESEFMVAMECLTGSREVVAGEVKLSPNPANDFLNIQLPEDITQAVEFTLFDAQGKSMFQEVITPGQTINVENLAKGLYVVKGKIGNAIYIGRFVKL